MPGVRRSDLWLSVAFIGRDFTRTGSFPTMSNTHGSIPALGAANCTPNDVEVAIAEPGLAGKRGWQMVLQTVQRTLETYDYPLLIRHLLAGAIHHHDGRRIRYRDEASFSYAEFQERVHRLASALRSLGVGVGTTVAVMDWDSHRYLECYFAVPMMGAVLQTVNVRLPPAQIGYTLAHSEAEVILVHRDFSDLLGTILPSLPRVTGVMAIMDGAADELPIWAHGEYEALTSVAVPFYPFADFDENAIATTFYTSGTTGDPKAVRFTHRQLVLHTLASCGPFGSTSDVPGIAYDDVYMPLTPMFHVHAWGVPYSATMLGVDQVYPGRYDPDVICRLRTAYGVSFSHCVPTVLRMVLDAAAAKDVDLSGWKMVIGGSALPESLAIEGRSRGMSIATGYGMSETGPMIAYSRPDRRRVDGGDAAPTFAAAAGVPVPLVYARIVDAEMTDVARDGVSRGELILRAPWLTAAYTGNEPGSEALWRGGWLHTQDVASMDADGIVRICDRLKDVIKTGGEWLDSIQLEELVATASGVAQVAVIGMLDDRWGERPVAVVVADAGAALSLDDLNAPIDRAIADGAISRYARLGSFRIVPSLPLTSVGKIDKKALRLSLNGHA